MWYARIAQDIVEQYGFSVSQLFDAPVFGHIKEVDLCDIRRRLLCEVTKSNKRSYRVHLTEHFPDEDFIRILCTKDIDVFDRGTHKIPYPKLCAMIDTGDVFKLGRTGKSFYQNNHK